jgi:hypothetical protein
MVTNIKQTALPELEFWKSRSEEVKLFLCLVNHAPGKEDYHSKAKASIIMHKVSGDLAVIGTGP